MSRARLEVLVEPFRENDPGPHVTAVVQVLTDAGLTVDMGPFATIAEGDLADVVSASSVLLAPAFAEGASALQMRIEVLPATGLNDSVPDV